MQYKIYWISIQSVVTFICLLQVGTSIHMMMLLASQGTVFSGTKTKTCSWRLWAGPCAPEIKIDFHRCDSAVSAWHSDILHTCGTWASAFFCFTLNMQMGYESSDQSSRGEISRVHSVQISTHAWQQSVSTATYYCICMHWAEVYQCSYIFLCTVKES